MCYSIGGAVAETKIVAAYYIHASVMLGNDYNTHKVTYYLW